MCIRDRAYGVSRLVHVSSVHAIPEPPQGQVIREVDAFDPDLVVGGYAKAKAEATQAVLEAAEAGLDAVVAVSYTHLFICFSTMSYILVTPPTASGSFRR